MTWARTDAKGKPLYQRMPTELDYENGGADQSQVKSADINHIMAEFQENGTQPRENRAQGDFLDNTDARTLHEAVNLANSAQAYFETLPSEVREAASNSVLTFSEMMENEDGVAALADAGLPVAWLDEGTTPSKPEAEQASTPSSAAQPSAEASKEAGAGDAST